MILENGNLRIEVSKKNGAITSLILKEFNSELLGEPRLAANFRLCVPKKDYLCNYVDGMQQAPASIVKDTNTITVVFTGLYSETGPVEIDLSYTITLLEDSVSFQSRLTNRGHLSISEFWFPRLGGWTQFMGSRDAKLAIPGYLSCRHEAGLFKAFPGGKNLGSEAAEFSTDYPGLMMPWWDIHDPKLEKGLYLGYHDPTFRFSTWHTYLYPNMSGRVGDAWLSQDDASGLPVGLVFSHVRYPFIERGESYEGGEFVIRLHDGDWHSGSQGYRQWFTHHFDVDKSQSWLRKKSAWFSSIIYQPEDRIVTDFEGYERWSQDANAYGITCHELIGWNDGGLERNYPEYTPEEKLGGRPGFRKLLKAIDERGDKCLVFVNYNILDSCTDWYARELHAYTHQNIFGQTPNWMAWGESTLLARKGINVHRHLLGSVVPPLVDILEDRLLKLVEDGAYGFQIDKLCVGSALDFNPLNTEKPDVALCEGLIRAIAQLLAKCRQINPAFCLAGEVVQDRLIPYIDIYYRNSSRHDISPLRYVFPEWTSCQHVSAPNDYIGINGAVLTGSVICVEPESYQASLSHPAWQRTAEYIREVERIRAELQDVIFLGKYHDTLGAKITLILDPRDTVIDEGDAASIRGAPGDMVRDTGQAHLPRPALPFAVHGSADDTRKAIVVVNESAAPIRYIWSFEAKGASSFVLYTPFQEKRAVAEAEVLEIPGESLHIILCSS
jgi:hypothetical protein